MTAVEIFRDPRPAIVPPLEEPALRRAAALVSCALHLVIIAGFVSHWPAPPAFGPNAEVVEVDLVEPIEAAQPPAEASRATVGSEPAALPQTRRSIVAEPDPAPRTEPSPPDDAPRSVDQPPAAEPAARTDAAVPPPAPDPVVPVTPDVASAPAEPSPPPVTRTASPREAPRIEPRRAPIRRAVERPVKGEPDPRSAATHERKATAAAPSGAESAATASSGRTASGGHDVLAAYLAAIKARIVGQRHPHVGGERGRVEVRFVISAEGSIGGIRSASTTSPALEDEAMRLVRRASPVAPIPTALGRTSLAMSVTVDFE